MGLTSSQVIDPPTRWVCHGNQPCTVSWLDDGIAPLLDVINICNVALYNGDAVSETGDGVWLGRLPHRLTANHVPTFATIIDLCAELPAAAHAGRHIALPALDLIPLSPVELRRAADAIETARKDGPVLVCCALGYGRSAAAVAAWLIATGRAPTPEAAIERLRALRPRIALETGSLS